MFDFFGTFLKKFTRNNKPQEEVAAVCPWCHRHIPYGAPIALRGLFRVEDKSKLPQGYKLYPKSESPAVIVVACCHQDCPANERGIFIAGFLEKGARDEFNLRPGALDKIRYLTYD